VVILTTLLGALGGWQSARLPGLVAGGFAGAFLSAIAGTKALLIQFSFTRCVAWLADGGSALRHAAFGGLLRAGIGAVFFLVLWVYVRKVIGK